VLVAILSSLLLFLSIVSCFHFFECVDLLLCVFDSLHCVFVRSAPGNLAAHSRICRSNNWTMPKTRRCWAAESCIWPTTNLRYVAFNARVCVCVSEFFFNNFCLACHHTSHTHAFRPLSHTFHWINSNSLNLLQCEWFDSLRSLKTLLLEGNGIKKIVGTFTLPALEVIWFVIYLFSHSAIRSFRVIRSFIQSVNQSVDGLASRLVGGWIDQTRSSIHLPHTNHSGDYQRGTIRTNIISHFMVFIYSALLFAFVCCFPSI
jgi:hypothetical protein